MDGVAVSVGGPVATLPDGDVLSLATDGLVQGGQTFALSGVRKIVSSTAASTTMTDSHITTINRPATSLKYGTAPSSTSDGTRMHGRALQRSVALLCILLMLVAFA